MKFIKDNPMLCCVLVMVGVAGAGLAGALGYVGLGLLRAWGVL